MRGKMDRSGDNQVLQLNLHDPWVMFRFLCSSFVNKDH